LQRIMSGSRQKWTACSGSTTVCWHKQEIEYVGL
jgi:hypothetical protein